MASDPHYYPSRLSTVDPHTGKVWRSFWHFGHLHRVVVLPDFFNDTRPAILAWGVNNKLDGFGDGLRGNERQLAHWDLVPVVMILDPANMDGLGPPPTNRIPSIPAARPHAYAFLDMPFSSDVPRIEVGGARGDSAKRGEIAGIAGLGLSPFDARDGTGPWLTVDIVAPDCGRGRNRALLTVDRNLQVRAVEVDSGDVLGRSAEYWRPIIQNGKYVTD